MKKWLKSFFRDWLYRRRYRSHCAKDIAKQIEWRLSLCHSAAPDVSAAYNLSRKLNELVQ